MKVKFPKLKYVASVLLFRSVFYDPLVLFADDKGGKRRESSLDGDDEGSDDDKQGKTSSLSLFII